MEQQTNILPILAIVISGLSMLVSVLNFYNARQAFIIAKRQFVNKKENFSLYLNDSFYYTKENTKYALFNVTIFNKSESKNSFFSFFEIKYISEDQNVATVKVDYKSNILDDIQFQKLTFFDNNVVCSEKESSTKWLVFKIPNNLKNKIIERYDIIFQDSTSNYQKIESFILKKLPDEN